MREHLTKEWIEKTEIFLKEQSQKIRYLYFKKQNDHPSAKIGREKYANSEKGKISRKKINSLRTKRVRNFVIPKNEKKLIQQFYLECPKDFQVDHIIPLSKGGKHCLSNLQWLKSEENFRKSASINFEYEGKIKCIPFDPKYPPITTQEYLEKKEKYEKLKEKMSKYRRIRTWKPRKQEP